MWARIEDNKIVEYYNRKQSIVLNNVRYSSQIFTIWTDAQRKDLGIVPVVISGTHLDSNYYIEKNHSDAIAGDGNSVIRTIGVKAADKNLNDVNEVWTQSEIDDGQAPDGTSANDPKLDQDGNQMITRGLKYNAIQKVKRQQIEQKIYEKYSGSSNAGKFILSFNEGTDTQSNIEAVQLSDAHNQYQFLSDESMRKIMVSHRIVSPMLLGIKDQSGLGNNADELKTASTLMDNTVIRPFQELLLDAFDKILAFNNISLNLYFKTLQPLEFTEIDSDLVDDETQEEETGVKMASDLDNQTANDILLGLDPDKVSDEWEEVAVREVSEDMPADEVWASYLIDDKKTFAQKLADAVTSKPSGFSYLDKSKYKVRYRYTEKYSSGNSRQFCQIMMRRSRVGEVYRLEDIDAASRDGVNKNFGHQGQPYDLFKYKGGPYCGHVWS